MPVQLTPYLSFRDEARQALDFYHSIFGGELTLSTFGDFNANESSAEVDKIMHGQLVAGDLQLMAADTPNEMPYEAGTNFAVSLSGGPDDEARLREYWDALSDDADIAVPLEPSPWGDVFGMLTDQFGVQWMVDIGRPVPNGGEAAEAAADATSERKGEGEVGATASATE